MQELMFDGIIKKKLIELNLFPEIVKNNPQRTIKDFKNFFILM